MAYADPIPGQHPNATDHEKVAQASEILERLGRGESTRAIAAAMGINRSTLFARLNFVPGGPRPGRRPGPLLEVVSYCGVHRRVLVAKGRAAEQSCSKCNAQAAQWAYTNDDPDELFDERGLRYSLDLTRYVPMCHSCHIRFDAAYRGA